MALLESFVAEPPPLRQDDTGTIRVGGTRITLDTVVEAWLNGESAEKIAEAYDALTLAEVYAVISYYLRHRSEVQDYLERRRQQAEESQARIEQRFPPQDLRAKLLARQKAGPSS